MKKIIALCVISSLLAGCLTAPKLKQKGNPISVGVPAQKTSLWCTGCGEASFSPYFSGAYRDEAAYRMDIQYSFDIKEFSGWGFLWGIISGCTLFTLPWQVEDHNWTATATLYNAQTGEQTTLSTLASSQQAWMSWLLIPWMGSHPWSGDDKKDYLATIQTMMGEVFIKEAAALVYQPHTSPSKWECVGYACKFKEMLKQKYFSVQDVIWIARNTDNFADFQTARKRLNGTLSTDDNCAIAQGLILDKKTVSKQTQLYWNLIEFYKKSCHPTEKGLGMHRADLLDTRGVPSGMYQVNADTEVITFSKIVDGKTQQQHYTLDRGIVTHIK